MHRHGEISRTSDDSAIFTRAEKRDPHNLAVKQAAKRDNILEERSFS